MIYTTFANVFLNIAVVGMQTIFDLYWKGRLKWLERKQRKAIAKQLLKR